MVNPYLEGNFAPVLEERTDDHPLEVTGVVPPDLEGVLLRNGPNPLTVPEDPADYHWFSGDGMLHGIWLAGGRATGYRNRWVRTRALAGKVATVPPRGPSEPIDGPANTHVVRHAGTTLALVESGFPHAVSPELDRARIHDFDGTLSSPMTAHPKVDPVTGELVFFGVDLFGPPFLRYHVVDAAGQLTTTEAIDVPRATMMHDFGVTATRAVFLDQPVVFDLALAAQGRRLPFGWAPEAGSRIGVLPRNGTGADIRWITMDPSYAFHVLNAFDDGDRTVLDLIRYDAVFETAPGEAITRSDPVLFRWTVDPAANRVHEEALDDTPVEFPRIDPAVAGSRHRYGYCVRTGADPEHPSFEGLVKYDFARDESDRYDPGEGRSPGEPVFVRAADGAGEDEGWVLTVVYDAARDASDLVILDATSFSGPPVATVHLPARVPFGFHGSWVPADS
jgi:carotenoid cleavage dioxygenase